MTDPPRSGSEHLVIYSISLPEGGEVEKLSWQIEASLLSLREHDSEVAVRVYVYGELTNRIADLLGELDVERVNRPALGSVVADLVGGGFEELGDYAPVHKWLSIASVESSRRTVLYVDCDTFFFESPRALTESSSADLSAREEPYSERSHLGVRGAHVDETRLREAAARIGATAVPPFNTGVICFRNQSWLRIRDRRSIYLELVQSFRSPNRPVLRWSGLSYPSENRWIAEQVAAWLMVGLERSLSVELLGRDHVLQGGEFSSYRADAVTCIVCHYFSALTFHFDAWLSDELVDSSHSD